MCVYGELTGVGGTRGMYAHVHIPLHRLSCVRGNAGGSDTKHTFPVVQDGEKSRKNCRKTQRRVLTLLSWVFCRKISLGSLGKSNVPHFHR